VDHLGSRTVTGLLVGGALLLPLPAPAVAGLLTFALGLHAVSHVATAAILTGETPAGRATTMALNGSAAMLGQALGAGLGGLLLALGGYAALGLGAIAWFAGAAAIVWWTRPRQVPTVPPAVRQTA